MISETRVELAQGPAVVWQGGDGPALVLIHGAWHGAGAHWSRVWDALAARFHVIAPELPGIGDTAAPGLERFGDYADWLERLLQALGVARAIIVGNSFGAAVAALYAGRYPARCRALVLVNGAPPPNLPEFAWRLIALPGINDLVAEMFRMGSWTLKALNRAFADPSAIPEEIRRTVAQSNPTQYRNARRLLLSRDEPPAPIRCPTLIVWGDADRLPGISPKRVRKLQQAIPGAQLEWVRGAGHLPQAERPREFTEAVERFAEKLGRVRSP